MQCILILVLLGVGATWARTLPVKPFKEKKFILGAGFSRVLGFNDQNPQSRSYIDLTEYYKQGCVECLGRGETMYAHPTACNLFIRCVDAYFFVLMYPESCGRGFFDESQSVCVSHKSPNVCPTPGNPCRNPGHKIPVDLQNCGQYLKCENNELIIDDCEPGFGFNAMTSKCDTQCPVKSRQLTVVNERCSKASDAGHIAVEQEQEGPDETGRMVRKTVRFKRQCPASMKHLNASSCQCERENVSTDCKVITTVHLSSSDNTWELARNNTPTEGTSSITGNATVANDTYDFPRSAFFGGRHAFIAHKILGNDLSLRFYIKFNFLPMTIANGELVPGISKPDDEHDHDDFALADNSMCGVKPTYGCKLTVSGTNLGKVTCYVKPQNMTDAHVEVTSTPVALDKRVFVTFARDDEKGFLRVSEENRRNEQEIPVQFAQGVHASGNACPLAIGAGTMKRYFRGYMDDDTVYTFRLEIVKPCPPFLEQL